MAKICLIRDSDGNPVSKLVSELSGQRILLNLADKTHPIRALTQNSKRFAGALSSCLKSLEESDKRREKGPNADAEIVERFAELVYRGTELLDIYAIDLPKIINLKPNRGYRESADLYRSTCKRHRAFWGLLCNRLKHNQNILVPVGYLFTPSNRFIMGFSLCRPVGADALEINKELHKGSEKARSVTIALHQILHDLFRIDAAAAKVISGLPNDGSEQLPAFSFVWNIGAELETLAKRPVWQFPKEKRMFDGIEIDPTEVCLKRKSADVIREGGKSIAIYSGDGMNRTFPLF